MYVLSKSKCSYCSYLQQRLFKGVGGGGMCVIKSEYENPLFHILRRKSRPRIGIRVAAVLMFMSSSLSQYQSILESFVPTSLLLSRGFKAM